MTPGIGVRVCDGIGVWRWKGVCHAPIMQFQNQFAAVEMATPLERMGSWKISPIITQPAGPHVLFWTSVIIRSNKKKKANLRREEENEKTHEHDQNVTGRSRIFRSSADDGDDEFANCHAHCSPDEEGATAEFLDRVEGYGR